MKKIRKAPAKKVCESRMRVPSALLQGLTLECIDRRELLIGGCKRIESYSTCEILLATRCCKVRVRGAELSIAFTENRKILLSGKVCSIEFE